MTKDQHQQQIEADLATYTTARMTITDTRGETIEQIIAALTARGYTIRITWRGKIQGKRTYCIHLN